MVPSVVECCCCRCRGGYSDEMLKTLSVLKWFQAPLRVPAAYLLFFEGFSTEVWRNNRLQSCRPQAHCSCVVKHFGQGLQGWLTRRTPKTLGDIAPSGFSLLLRNSSPISFRSNCVTGLVCPGGGQELAGKEPLGGTNYRFGDTWRCLAKRASVFDTKTTAIYRSILETVPARRSLLLRLVSLLLGYFWT